MYEDFYHLRADPFRLTPDPRFCYQHHSYQLARAYLLYAFRQAEGFVLVAGRTGTGKTTLIEAFQKELKQSRVVTAMITSTSLGATDLLRAAAYSFGIDVEGLDKATLLRRIEQFLLRQTHSGKRVLLIVDEAQGLQPTALEELRLLADLHTSLNPLLQVFLVGQEKLQRLMSTPDMEQFQQRVIGTCCLEPMNLSETRAYVEHRLQQAGWQGDPRLTGAAIVGIYRYSKGVPRHINKICSRLLSHGIVENRHTLDQADVQLVAAELRGEQLSPLDNDPGVVASIEDSALAIDDLAIQAVSQAAPRHEPTTRTDATVPMPLPAVAPSSDPSTRRVAANSQAPLLRDTATAPPGRKLLQRLAAIVGIFYDYATRFTSLLRQHAKQRLPAYWSHRYGQLAIAAGAMLTIISLAIYNDENGNQHKRLLLVGNQAISSPPAIAITAEHPAETGPTITSDFAMLLLDTTTAAIPENATAEVDDNTQPATGAPFRPSKDTVTSSPASGSADTPPPAERKNTLEIAQSDQGAERPIPDAPAASPATESDDVTDVSGDNGTALPAASKGSESDDAAPVEIAALEASASVTPTQPLPPEDSRRGKITDLLTRARASLDNDRLLFPENNSAYGYYQQVLALQADNSDALQGLNSIVNRYMALAATAMERGHKDAAQRYVARGLRVLPGDQRLLALQDSLRTLPVVTHDETPLPLPPMVTEQPPAIQPGPEEETLFSRLRAFFAQGQPRPEKTSAWDDENSDW